jgi:hypothetical protein
VANAARHAQHAPIKRQTAMAFGPSVAWCCSGGASESSGLLPGSSTEKTTHDIPVPTNCGSVVYKFMMPRYFPVSPPELLTSLFAASRPPSRCSVAGGSYSPELRRTWAYAWAFCEMRFISTPRNAKGAQHATDQDLFVVNRVHCHASGRTYTPQTAIIKVALRKLRTNGAKTMELANRQCAMVQAVSSEGLYFSISLSMPATLFGGREVKPGTFSSAGDFTKNGSNTDITNVMMLKAMRAVEPTRPTFPVKSPDALTSAGAS